ncbi:hypothetical protein K438DRAFT_1997250 [Mycena galopus ATCC 62051]|nr:hypothetical protein K438DRAFT_1997250 [Mycena galopus ATCC 62051]
MGGTIPADQTGEACSESNPPTKQNGRLSVEILEHGFYYSSITKDGHICLESLHIWDILLRHGPTNASSCARAAPARVLLPRAGRSLLAVDFQLHRWEIKSTPPLHTLGHGHGFGARPATHPTSLHPCFPFAPFTSVSNRHNVPNALLSLTYALHTLAPLGLAPSSRATSPLALITPSSYWLAQCANGYAHDSALKRSVLLVGTPLDLALDVRGGVRR